MMRHLAAFSDVACLLISAQPADARITEITISRVDLRSSMVNRSGPPATPKSSRNGW